MKIEKIYFNPDEVQAVAMGLARIIEDLNAMKQGEYINTPWTPEARKAQTEMRNAVLSAAAKIEKFTGVKCELPPYIPGDENDFLTKPS
jgi:hypothetical protein